MEDEKIEKVFGINLFSWKEWDDLGGEEVGFYETNWFFESMKKYNGLYVSLRRDGFFTISKEGEPINEYCNEMVEVLSASLLDIKEFAQAILLKIEV